MRPRQGRLTFAFHNVDAYARFGAETRSDTRFVDEDMNRVWSTEVLDGPRRTGDGYYESVVLDPEGNRLELTA